MDKMLDVARHRLQHPRTGDDEGFALFSNVSGDEFENLASLVRGTGKGCEVWEGKFMVKRLTTGTHSRMIESFRTVFDDMMREAGTQRVLQSYGDASCNIVSTAGFTQPEPDAQFGPKCRKPTDLNGGDFTFSLSTVAFEAAWSHGSLDALQEKITKFVSLPGIHQIAVGVKILGYSAERLKPDGYTVLEDDDPFFPVFPSPDSDCYIVYAERRLDGEGKPTHKVYTNCRPVKLGHPDFKAEEAAKAIFPGYPRIEMYNQALFEGIDLEGKSPEESEVLAQAVTKTHYFDLNKLLKEMCSQIEEQKRSMLRTPIEKRRDLKRAAEIRMQAEAADAAKVEQDRLARTEQQKDERLQKFKARQL